MDMDTMAMAKENIKFAMKNTRLKPTKFLLRLPHLRSPVLLLTQPPSKCVSPSLLRSQRSSVRTRLRTDVSMLPSLLMPPILLNRLRPSLESQNVTKSPFPSLPKPAPRLTMPLLHTIDKSFKNQNYQQPITQIIYLFIFHQE